MRCGASYSITEDCKFPPKRAYAGDAGLDIAVQETIKVRPGETVYAPAGVKFDIPEGYAVQVLTRSSTFKHDVVVVPTIIDSGYKDQISTIITNFNTFPVTIQAGTRLAQAILTPYFVFDNEKLDDGQDLRGSGKFGSTGV